jgi:signal transduction histidine kinase
LLNLLLNAADALSKSEGTGNDPSGKDAPNQRRPGNIRITASVTPDGSLELAVTDNGPGVPDSVRAHLFEPFVTTKDVGTGTGLGLAVCRGLVESASGSISLDEAYGNGARFRLTLPVATLDGS